MKLYLAGKMSGLSFEQMNNWREEAAKIIKSNNIFNYKTIKVINPVSYYNFELDPSTYTEKEVKDFDLKMVEISDIVLVNLEYPDSIGTAIELELASRWHKPIIAFNVSENIHPWMNLVITKKCDTLNDAIDYINDFYADNL